MDAQDLRMVLEKTNDKLSIFTSQEKFSQYKFTEEELLHLISDFLSDEEKLKLFDCSYFQKSRIKQGVVKLISDENVKLEMLNNDNIITRDFPVFSIIKIIKDMTDNGKKQILYNQDFIEEHQFDKFDLEDIISSIGDEVKSEILTDSDFITQKLHIENNQITELTMGISNEAAKVKILETYECLSKIDKRKILSSLNAETLNEFLKFNKGFCNENNIQLFEIIRGLDDNEQKKFVTLLENMDVPLSEKRKVLATLKENVKQSIDTSALPEEYKTAFSIQVTKDKGRVILDLEKNLEDYRGLDDFIIINPEKFTQDQRAKFMKLCDICPGLKVVSSLDKCEYFSTAAEYKEAETWITSMLDNINPEYSKAQKLAVIDNAIGKRISYTPEYDTEVCDEWDCRALWKIISSGYGVCNGISKVGQYILNRVEIESEIINGMNHSFLKIKDIELPLANGEVVKGNTILDTTWNLSRHRFGAKPENFCISYEEIRKHDNENGKDGKYHKNDEALQDATLNLDEKSLRKLFTSVELADNEGNFPIKDLIEKSKKIDEVYATNPNKNIDTQFLLLSKKCPEFAECQNSSMVILSSILLNNENLRFNKCVVNRVYEKTDKAKKPVLFVFIDSNEMGKKFYYADKDEGQFVELPQEEFVKNFECYEQDLRKNKRT